MFCQKKRHDHLILGRMYALTSTTYKHLKIGISASYVTTSENYSTSEILLVRITDNRDNRIYMSLTTWKAIMEHCADIEQLVQSTSEAISPEIHDLIIEIVKIRNKNVVKFTSHDTSIYVQPSTIRFMLDLEYCVKNALRSIWQNAFIVDAKYKEFVTIIYQNCINNKCDALKKLCEVYDKTSLIDCELVMYALNEIVDNAIYFSK